MIDLWYINYFLVTHISYDYLKAAYSEESEIIATCYF